MAYAQNISFLIWCLLCFNSIVFICNADKSLGKCLSFSGGGIRAAMGAYVTMNQIQKAGKLADIRCISVISGGSWGFSMWLYEHSPGVAGLQIKNYIQENGKWGAKGPAEIQKMKNYYENWAKEIQTNIIDMTSLKGTTIPKFQNDVREQLNKRGLTKVTVYWVVEKVNPSAKNALVDYCWFQNHVTSGAYVTQDIFDCSKKHVDPKMNKYTKFKILRKGTAKGTTKAEDVTFLDVLSYCSSAWATVAGKTNTHGHSTRPLSLYPGGNEHHHEIRIVDAGGTFNDALVPYFVKPQYTGKSVEIWNFDFSHYDRKKGLSSALKKGGWILEEISRLKPALESIGRTITKTEHLLKEKMPEGVYKFTFDDRIVVHCPLYGKNFKDTFIDYYPTMHKVYKVYPWHFTEFVLFRREWMGHMEDILSDEKDW